MGGGRGGIRLLAWRKRGEVCVGTNDRYARVKGEGRREGKRCYNNWAKKIIKTSV